MEQWRFLEINWLTYAETAISEKISFANETNGSE